jgi:hypothetical protein
MWERTRDSEPLTRCIEWEGVCYYLYKTLPSSMIVVTSVISLTYGGGQHCLLLEAIPVSNLSCNLLREGSPMYVQKVAQLITTHLGMRRDEGTPGL